MARSRRQGAACQGITTPPALPAARLPHDVRSPQRARRRSIPFDRAPFCRRTPRPCAHHVSPWSTSDARTCREATDVAPTWARPCLHPNDTRSGNTCLWLRLPKRCRADTDGVDVAGSCVGRFARDAAPYVSNWSLEFVNQLRYLNDVAPAYPDAWRRRTRPRTRWPSDHVRGTAPQADAVCDARGSSHHGRLDVWPPRSPREDDERLTDVACVPAAYC